MSARTLAFFTCLLAWAAQAQPARDGGKDVPRYGVFELPLTAKATFANPFTEARATAEFRSPDGRRLGVEGFYYGGSEWRVRFAPDVPGEWSYEARLAGKGETVRKSGSFRCVASNRRGFVRVSRRNPYRFEYGDGTPFYPIGVQTCGYFQVDLDGPNDDGSWKVAPAASWAEAFQGATNLARWQLGAGTKKGCALALIPEGGPPDRYDLELARKMDDLFALQKAHGFSHLLVLFQDMSLWGKDTTSFGETHDLAGYKSVKAPNLALQDAYVRYVVARFGCFVDMWELFNEDSYAPDDYLAHLAAVVREADPYRHPVTTNYTRAARWNDASTWHAYMSIPANEVDLWVSAQAGKYKSYGKPVLNTEFGNKGILSNVDPIKWRVATWTAFLSESNILFWGMSGRKTEPGSPRGNSNAYLGPDTRQHLRVLNDFTRDLPVDLRPVECTYSQRELRVHAMANGRTAVVYVHHWTDYGRPYTLEGKIYVHTGAGTFRAKWIDPATGAVVNTQQATARGQYTYLDVPPVTIDLACRLERD